ncbi:hypothetical protein [Piscibacillus halophilus]|uniref:hypothetical protein n=1 Tax=Piscibacillus halophilus TaxID=571933 RepID=UPI00240A370E|nr:hypothetical protein [Piscibacillus halophilus]
MALQKVIQDAKMHKKLFEKYTVHPFYVHLNGNDFYLVFYSSLFSKGNDFIISATNNRVTKGDYNKALELLVFLLNNGASIVKNGNARKNINMLAFEKTKSFLSQVAEKVRLDEDIKNNYKNALNTITNNLILQNELIELMDRYHLFIEQKRENDGNRFIPEDVEYVQTILATLDYIQYQQLNNELNTFDDFVQINEDLNYNSQVKELITSDVKRYITEFSKNKSALEQEIKKVTYFENQGNLTKEEHVQLVKESYKDTQRGYLKDLKKDLRNLD